MRGIPASVCALVLAAAPAAAPAVAQADMQPGSYTTTTTLTVPRMPPPQVSAKAQCFTQAEAKDPAAYTRKMLSTMYGACTFTDQQQDPLHLSANFSCRNTNQTTAGHVDMTAAVASLDITLTIKIGELDALITIDSVRMGDC